ncbi:MAG: CDGSH iron-sulfur domain-containing protein [Coriobacteriia bacterium]|nr:CDGSH iron-sulfur domain-containing protein [Actinomycetota bacterium]MDZ4166482.1 CDGSH iron-sulfur domain-containing protein [Coriobacteriia bacterium]
MSADPTQGPHVEAIEDGPFRYRRGSETDTRARLCGSDRDEIPSRDSVLLCRCGASERKPFCDGSHVGIGFSSTRMWKPGAGSEIDHHGADITIHDNRALCAHVEYCVLELPGVFDRSKRPWVNPDGASVEEIIALCDKCPSGALGYSIGGVRGVPPDRPPTVVVSAEGPYFLEGGVEVVDPNLPEAAHDEHCTLCRCGASRNKPLCDGKHVQAGFTGTSE